MTFPEYLIFKTVRAASPGVTTEQVIAQVRELIRRGKLRPGDRLPGERELAKRLGVSRPSLRAGLRSLAAMGVLETRHGAGTFVADGPPALDSEPLSLLAALHGFTPDEMFEARRVLEVGLAGLAAERATSEHQAEMAEEVAEMFAALDDPQRYLVHDIRFHRAVAAASGNPILAALMGMVSEVLYERRRETVARARDLKESAEWHRKIFRAIRAHNPEAARAAMSEHLTLAQRALASEEIAENADHAAPADSGERKPEESAEGAPKIHRQRQRAAEGTSMKAAREEED
jgi:GntR family transcriptional repressor for pyruvate dehydrogenase complex